MSSADTARQTTNEAADLLGYYHNDGCKLVRLSRKTKKNVDQDWPHKNVPLSEIIAWYERGGNIGKQLGEVSDWRGAVDCDCPEAVRLAPRFLPDTLRLGKGSGVPDVYLYRSPGLGFKKFADLDGETLIDLKASDNGAGHQIAVPPSIHPEKGPYRWERGYNPAAIAGVPASDLRAAVGALAVATLITRHLPDRGRHDLAMALAGYMLRNGEAIEAVEHLLTAAWEARKAPRDHVEDVRRIVADTSAKLKRGEPATGGRTLEELVPGVAAKIAKFLGWERADNRDGRGAATIRHSHNLTDLGNASRLIAHHGQDLRYCYPWGSWLIWDGRRWSLDESGEIHRRAKQTVTEIYREAADAADDETRKALAKHAVRSEAENRIQAMISLAKSEVPIMPAAMDANPWLMNVATGTINLKTGELLEHRREDLITKLAGEYDPTAAAPTWAATLERVLPSAEVRAFFKRLCGYAISGDVSEHVLPVLYGTGANGKSTILNALLEAAGEYGMQAAPDLLIAKRGGHPTEVADLFGMRVVASIEVEDGRRLAETLVKSLTGGDKVRARRMRQDFWQFDPTHTAFLCTNHKPEIRGNDAGIWRRIRLIPFTETIAPAEQDKRLPTKLRSELPGILAWAVEGCLEWQRDGLKAPEEVRKATGAYRSEMDVIGAFLRDECETQQGYSATFKEVFARYEEWCEEAGEKPETRRKFNARLKERGPFFDRRSGPSGANEWHGLQLLKKQNAGFAGKLKEHSQNDYNELNTASRSGNSTNNFSSSVTSVEPTEEQQQRIDRRVHEGWAPHLAREEVLGR